MAVGNDSASMGSDEILSSGKEPWTEKSTRACASCAGGVSRLAMARAAGDFFRVPRGVTGDDADDDDAT